MNRLPLLIAFLGAMLSSVGALAQTFPAKPINLYIPFPPGTAVDMAGRIVATKLSELLGQTMVPTNREGASGNIAVEVTANAAPDGYTLVVGSTSYSINLYTMKNSVPFSRITPVAMIGMQPYTLMVPRALPVKNIRETIALFKSKQGQFNAAAGGPTGTSSFLLNTLKKEGGFEIEIVVYKGTVPAVADLLVERTHMLFAPLVTSLPYYKAGKIQLLGVTGAKRLSLIPDVPTFIESGFPGLDVPTWFALMGPAGIPRPVVTRINQAVIKALGSKDVLTQLSNFGIEPTPRTVEESEAFLRQDIATWGRMSKEAGVVAQ